MSGARRELSGAINTAQKQDNIPQLVLCMSARARVCVCCSCKLWGQGCKLGEVSEEGRSGCTCVSVIKEEGAQEGLPQSEETGGWA